MDLPREHTRFGRAVLVLLRLAAIALGLGVVGAGLSFAANVGEIMLGAPIIFVGGMLIASGVKGRWMRRLGHQSLHRAPPNEELKPTATPSSLVE